MRKSCCFHDFCGPGWPSPDQLKTYFATGGRFWGVSQDWINGFPRRLWHREGDQWYEASTNAGTAGAYHAYPLEPASLPVGLQYEL